MQSIKFTVRSLDARRTRLLASTSDVLDPNDEAAIFMFMVDTIETAQKYLGAKVLSEPALLEDLWNEIVFYVTFEFSDIMTKSEFEYYIISRFLP